MPANQILQYLPSLRVFFAPETSIFTKKRVFEEASVLFQSSGIPRQMSFNAFVNRERLGNTTLGRGTAVPHARLKGMASPMVALVILPRPIPVDPVPSDGKPVDLFLFLLVPDDGDDDSYLGLLHECIAMLDDADVCSKLRNCQHPVEACEVVLNWKPPESLAVKAQKDELVQDWAEYEKERRQVGKDF